LSSFVLGKRQTVAWNFPLQGAQTSLSSPEALRNGKRWLVLADVFAIENVAQVVLYSCFSNLFRRFLVKNTLVLCRDVLVLSMEAGQVHGDRWGDETWLLVSALSKSHCVCNPSGPVLAVHGDGMNPICEKNVFKSIRFPKIVVPSDNLT
jgi:hypothetical protein